MQHLRQERRSRPALPGVLVLPIPTFTPVACRPAGKLRRPRTCIGAAQRECCWPSAPAWERTGRAKGMGRPRCFWESTGVRRGGAGVAPGWRVPNSFSFPSSFYFFPELSPLTRGAELRGLAVRKSRCLGGRIYSFSRPCQALRVRGNASLPGRGSPWPAPLL